MAAAAPTFDWMFDPLDFVAAKPATGEAVAKPLDPKEALLQRAMAPERSTTVYELHPRTPDQAASAGAAQTKKKNMKHMGPKERIVKVLRKSAPKINKRWHPDGIEHSKRCRVESETRLLLGVKYVPWIS